MGNNLCKVFTSELSFSRKFKCENVLLLTVDAKYLHAQVKKNKSAERKINRHIEKTVSKFYDKAVGNLLCEANNAYRFAKDNDYVFNGYEAYLLYTPTLSGFNFLSYYYDEYIYSGGAHGNTVRASDTFDSCTGKILPLGCFFKKSDYQKLLINLIIMQADDNMIENPGIYFENYRELIKENFNPQNYFLTEDSICIYFQQYEIAPYATGIVVFEIPFSAADCPPFTV